MGSFNSSLTRVVPVFDKLRAIDPTGMCWMNRLLALAEPGSATLPNPEPLKEWGWGQYERGLSPPKTLLQWLIENPDTLCCEGLKQCRGRARLLRERLISGDKEVQRKALDRLERPHRDRAWFLFEGVTYPDVYMKTNDAIIVIEGKRTEADITRHTTWMVVRHQMLRHIDCAWDERDGRIVIGMFIVEGNAESTEVPQHWHEACAETVHPNVLNLSLPHRLPTERDKIARAYLGVTTWQRVCQEFHIPWERLPDVVQ